VPTDTAAGFTEGLNAVKHAAAALPLATLTLVTLGHLAMNFTERCLLTLRMRCSFIADANCMFTRLNVTKLHVLPTHCIYVFCLDLRTNSDYFPIQH